MPEMEAKQKDLKQILVHEADRFWTDQNIADRYDPERFHNSVWGRLYPILEERIVAKALKKYGSGARALDAACGTGRVTLLLKKLGFRVIGCDISASMMNVARRKVDESGHAPSFVQTDARFLPYRDSSFDIVSCVGLVMHLDQTPRVEVLKELRRVSRGIVIVQFGCSTPFLRLIERITGRKAGNVKHPIDEKRMDADIRESGLKEETRSWVQRPLSSSVVLVLSK